MVQLSDDCFAHDGKLLPTSEALALLAERLDCVTETQASPTAKALGHILRDDLHAKTSMPPNDNSAVDGYAVRHHELSKDGETRWPIAARITAGEAPPSDLPENVAVRIFTGAAMPAGFDSVFMQEDCRLDGDHVVLPQGLSQGANRRKFGEDFTEGALLLSAGQMLRPQDLGLAAAAGHATLTVSRPLRIALFSTGNELVEPGEALPVGAIHDSNRYTLMGLIRAMGCEATDLGILADNERVVRLALAQAAVEHDLIITSGGVSVGEEDHVKAAVEALGKLHAWRLAIKPGRPIALGQVSRVPFIGLPGNPVAVMVTFLLIARPAILRLMGAKGTEPRRYKVPAGFSFRKKGGRREWLRVRMAQENGAPHLELFEKQGSGILTSLVEADGLVELPEDLTEVESGAMVDYLPFNEVL